MGLPKVLMADSRLAVVNSTIQMTAYQNYLDENNGAQILEGCDVVIDALDSPKSKLMLQKVCKDLGIPMVHGAIDGWFGQVTTIMPGSDTLNDVYKETEVSAEGGNPSFTPAVVAGMQVSEALKVLTGNKEILDRKVLYIDLLTNETKKVEL
jgi:molybdopterin/thiamine biosynthesis adenylyltransferase